MADRQNQRKQQNQNKMKQKNLQIMFYLIV